MCGKFQVNSCNEEKKQQQYFNIKNYFIICVRLCECVKYTLYLYADNEKD